MNVSILDFIGGKDDGGGVDNWNCKTCKALVKSSLSTNKQTTIYKPDALPLAQPTVSKH